MTRDKIIELIADVLEIEDKEVSEEKVLQDYETWDSIAIISLISAISEETGRFLHASEIKCLKTVGEIIPLFSKDDK